MIWWLVLVFALGFIGGANSGAGLSKRSLRVLDFLHRRSGVPVSALETSQALGEMSVHQARAALVSLEHAGVVEKAWTDNLPADVLAKRGGHGRFVWTVKR